MAALILSPEQRAAVKAALQPLFDYAETSPAEELGEGYWDDMESAFNCGERQEQSKAAAIMRGALAGLGFEAPAGIAVCLGCDRDADEEHAPECELAAEDEEG